MSERTQPSPPAHDWLTPVTPDAPCGADLEYDPEFVVLTASLLARMDAQYGDFVGVPEPVNWTDIDRDCRSLMLRSKDMRLAVIHARCRTRLAGAAGLADGLALLAVWLDAFAGVLHPQPEVDDDPDAALQIRTNALQALTDADGLLLDVREIVLARASATHLRVRDVERAFAFPRLADALAPESVIRQIADLRRRQPLLLTGFDAALATVQRIDDWCRRHLGAFAPDLSALAALLALIANTGERSDAPSAPEPQEESAAPLPVTNTEPVAEDCQPCSEPGVSERVAVPLKPVPDRHAALASVREARVWFEQHEPSSPIPLLLRRAELFCGKPYPETVKAIPPELIEQWARECLGDCA